jgi:hypothetical protein
MFKQTEQFVDICKENKTKNGLFDAHFVSQILSKIPTHWIHICLCSVNTIQHGLFEKSECDHILNDLLFSLVVRHSSMTIDLISDLTLLGEKCWEPLFDQIDHSHANNDFMDRNSLCFRLIPTIVKIACHLQSTEQSQHDDVMDLCDSSSSGLLDSLFGLSWTNHHLVPAMCEALIEVYELWSENYTVDLQVRVKLLEHGSLAVIDSNHHCFRDQSSKQQKS